ncbi:MAG: CotH kinase family protein [Verrucomicrobia bacterium]|nr:CotH kinase family protein [Verrucomicrobiota bacterium]
MNHKIKLLLITGILCLQTWGIHASGVFISEFMAVNNGSLMDKDGQNSDWIEICNSGDEDVSLKGWGLTDKAKKPFKWIFPDIVLKAKQRLLVFASGREQNSPDEELHCNFKLSAESGYLALTEISGKTATVYENYPKQYWGVSYGYTDDLSRTRYFCDPTPGAANLLGPQDRGPILSEHQYLPALPDRPSADQPVNVTIRVDRGVQDTKTVLLRWIIGRNSDLHETPMFDDGEHGDGIAEDGIYGAFIPCDDIEEGEVVRWYIRAIDIEGHVSRWPYFLDPARTPEYFGTVTAQSPFETHLPVIEIFPDNLSIGNGCRGCLVFNNEFYENVFFQNKGQTTSFFNKRSFGVEFNKDHKFLLFDGMERYSDLRLISPYGDKSKVRSSTAYSFFERAGVPAQKSFPVRVQARGEFRGIYDLTEDGDEPWLERSGLDPNGALYKIDDNLEDVNASTKRTRRWEDNSDLEEFIYRISSAFQLHERVDYLYDHTNIPEMVNYFAASLIMNHADQGWKNYYLYRDSDGSGEWKILPWDLDLTWGRYSAPYYFNDNIQTDLWLGWWYIINGLYLGYSFDPNLSNMIRCRLLTLMDEEFYWCEAPDENLPFLREMRAKQDLMDPEGLEVTDMELDEKKWPNSIFPRTPREEFERIRDAYLPQRIASIQKYMESYPVPEADCKTNIQILEIVPSSLLKNASEAYICLTNIGDYPVDISHWKLRGMMQYDFDPGTVLLAGNVLYVTADLKAFRAREVFPTGGFRLFAVGPYRIDTENPSTSLELYDKTGELISQMDYSGDVLGDYASLRITEIMYAPAMYENDINADLDNYAWLELTNCGTNAIQLKNIQIADGITFTFPDHVLLPKESLVVTKNKSVFETRYKDSDIVALGNYSGNLARKGETIQLLTPEGMLIQQITYSNKWYPETDRGGRAIELNEPLADAETMSLPANWSPTLLGGTPGYYPPYSPPRIIAETLTVDAEQISFRIIAGSHFIIEKSNDLQTWEPVLYEAANYIVTLDREGENTFYRVRIDDE